MNGLQKMVYLRGGLQSLGWDGVLHMFISWYSIPLAWPSARTWLDPSEQEH